VPGSSRSTTNRTTAAPDTGTAPRSPQVVADISGTCVGTCFARITPIRRPLRSWGTTVTATRSLRPEPAAPRTAREFCVAHLNDEAGDVATGDLDVLAGDAAIVVSELVTNAIRAGAATIRLEVGRSGDAFRIAVADDAAGVPILAEADPTAEGGRGLHIVNALSTQWGVEPGEWGKRVWADVALSAPATDAVARARSARPVGERRAAG
jgi:hypothetical protein